MNGCKINKKYVYSAIFRTKNAVITTFCRIFAEKFEIIAKILLSRTDRLSQ